jgi:hypothetical protein
MEIEARGDLAASTAVIADQMTARLGPGPVAAKMTAYIIDPGGEPALGQSANAALEHGATSRFGAASARRYPFEQGELFIGHQQADPGR